MDLDSGAVARPWHLTLLAAPAVALIAGGVVELGAPSQSTRSARELVTAERGVVQSTVSGLGQHRAGLRRRGRLPDRGHPLSGVCEGRPARQRGSAAGHARSDRRPTQRRPVTAEPHGCRGPTHRRREWDVLGGLRQLRREHGGRLGSEHRGIDLRWRQRSSDDRLGHSPPARSGRARPPPRRPRQRAQRVPARRPPLRTRPRPLRARRRPPRPRARPRRRRSRLPRPRWPTRRSPCAVPS